MAMIKRFDTESSITNLDNLWLPMNPYWNVIMKQKTWDHDRGESLTDVYIFAGDNVSLASSTIFDLNQPRNEIGSTQIETGRDRL